MQEKKERFISGSVFIKEIQAHLILCEKSDADELTFQVLLQKKMCICLL